MAQVLFLTQNHQLFSLCQQYWLLDENNEFVHTAKDLCNLYKVKIYTLHAIASKNSQYVSDVKCQSCGKNKIFYSRSEFNKFRLVKPAWTCESCILIPIKRKETLIEEYINTSFKTETYNIDDLNESSMLYLAVFLDVISKDCWRNGYKYQYNQKKKLTHSIESDLKVLTFLFEVGLIKLKLHQSKTSFYLQSNGVVNFDVKEVWFLINIDQSECDKIYDIIKTDLFLEKIKSNCLVKTLAQEMQIDMCIKKAIDVSSELGIQIREITNLFPIFEFGLSVHSMNNMYYFIWRSIRDALVQSQKRGVVKIQAMRSIPIRINSDIHRSIEKEWDVYKQAIPADYPAFARVLFNHVFSRHDYSFYTCIEQLFKS